MCSRGYSIRNLEKGPDNRLLIQVDIAIPKRYMISVLLKEHEWANSSGKYRTMEFIDATDIPDLTEGEYQILMSFLAMVYAETNFLYRANPVTETVSNLPKFIFRHKNFQPERTRHFGELIQKYRDTTLAISEPWTLTTDKPVKRLVPTKIIENAVLIIGGSIIGDCKLGLDFFSTDGKSLPFHLCKSTTIEIYKKGTGPWPEIKIETSDEEFDENAEHEIMITRPFDNCVNWLVFKNGTCGLKYFDWRVKDVFDYKKNERLIHT